MNLPWLEATVQDLSDRIEAGRLGHAPLIHGPSGIGKQVLGDWLARRLLCTRPSGSQPCGECQSCQLIDGGTHPDRFVIAVPEDKQGIGVDQIRDLIDRLQLTASVGERRVGVLVQADAMNTNAANALLKTLEEPPGGAWLILLSEQPARLPATVRSRCQQIVLRPPPEGLARGWLDQACRQTDEDDRATALSVCGGAPLAARELLESGGLETGLAILADLSGRSPHAGILERWQADPAVTWQWLARWMALLMGRASDAASWQPPGQALPPITDRRRIAGLWQQALDGRREALRGVVRQDLLLGRWLLEWEAAQPARN